jgi:hypothetical protein
VRIFPDEIFADTHEPGLTEAEQRDGAAYVAAINTPGEMEGWRKLVARYTAPRAAWIAKASAKGSPGSRGDSWTRAAQAQLPDGWVVRAYQGAKVFTSIISTVKQPLALTVSPSPGAQVPISDGLTVDAELEWTLHYDAAVAAGMAVTIDLTKPDLIGPVADLPRTVGPDPAGSAGPTGPHGPTGPAAPPPPSNAPPAGIDVVVVGVHNITPGAAATLLRGLIDAHHYTRGFAFVAPGTPTSNSTDASTQFPPSDPAGANSFAVERQGPLAAPGDHSDGDLFARALGLPLAEGEKLAAVEHISGAGTHQDALANAMNDSLWPATLGYFMEQMMAPIFDDTTIGNARTYFNQWVRPGGPLPAFRIGRVPYGILPAVSLAHYSTDTPLSRTLRALRDDKYVPAIANVPRVTASSTDPDGDLLKALAIDASCRQARIRMLLGQDVAMNTASLLGLVQKQWLQAQEAVRAAQATAVLRSVGLVGDTRIAHIDRGLASQLLGVPLVAPLISETTGVDYVDTLIGWASATPVDVQSIQSDKLPGTVRPLLYRILRHALLLEMDRVSSAPPAVRPPPPVTTAASAITSILDRTEPELVNLGSTPTVTSWGRIQQAAAGPALGSSILPYLGSLRTITKLSSADLERRFGETLDTCSHRLDPWITSLATQQLWTMRKTEPTGIHLGAFGWVENVLPANAGAPLGGFIHAPSATHASAAAILRNGYLSRGGSGSAYAVNLSSARVRKAHDLLDGTRQGESLAALLGYQFERALHDANLERLIASLRSQYPLTANRTKAGVGPTELVAATNVVDGLALRKVNPPPPAGLSSADATSFIAAVKALDDSVDALTDLLTAESVFQAVRGNPPAAVASLDAMAQGVSPPDPDVIRTPLGGAAFTQRLAVVLDGTIPAPDKGTPRAATEPHLDAWLDTLLGDLTQVGCRVVQADGTAKEVTLDQLKLRPIDIVTLAKIPATGAGDSELDRRVLTAAAAASGSRIQYDATRAPHSFAERIELARSAALLIGGARPLLPADLVAPPDVPNATVTLALAQAAAGRAQDGLNGFAAAALSLTSAHQKVATQLAAGLPPVADDVSKLSSALQSIALYGVTGAYPDPNASASDLAASATATETEVAARQARVPQLTSTDPSQLLAAAIDAMRAIFGRDFLFLPQLTPTAPVDLAAGLTESRTLVGDDNLPRQVLQQMARVRPAIGRWRSLFLYAEALGTASPTIEVVQLPTKQTTWAAGKGATPANGTLSMLLHRPTQSAPTQQWTGLIIDEWTELIPSSTQPTSIAFRHETPVADAPQAVLLAVPPPGVLVWDQQTIIDTVRESLLLAKVRLVDAVDTLQPFLPAICLTGNTANETVSTDFLSSLVADPQIVGSA